MLKQLLCLCFFLYVDVVISENFESTGYCYTKYVHVSVVKQVPSYSKHCSKVDDVKCKTTFKNSFTTKMETQCTPTFDTSCSTVLQTAYKQECKTITDVECRIVNLDKHGKHVPKKICTDVPTEKCVPVPVKIESEKCVNIPTQSCQNVPVVANVPVPQKQCFRKPRKVCQTVVSTKPKVVIERIPQTVCPHDQPLSAAKASKTSQPGLVNKVKSAPIHVPAPGKKQNSHNHPHRIDEEMIQGSSSFPQKVYIENDQEQVENDLEPVYDEYPEVPEAKQLPMPGYNQFPQGSYKNQDIPIYEEQSNYLGNPSQQKDESLEYDEASEDYNDYKSNANSHADILHEYFKHLNHNYQSSPYYHNNLDRSDQKDLFSGDIGEKDIVKRDENSDFDVIQNGLRSNGDM